MVSEQFAAAMTHEEATAFGLNPFLNEDSLDNFAVEGMLRSGNTVPQSDSRGRAIISFRQFEEMKKRDMRMDNYALRMVGPSGRGLIQASKYIKYAGEGYVPIEVMEARRKTEARTSATQAEREGRAPKPTLVVSDEDYTIYRCAEKYPGCPRFFDSQRALETHWGMPQPSGHGVKKLKSKKNVAEIEAQIQGDDIPVSMDEVPVTLD